ncbi:MAG TPA: dual specificity protein phosphatase family protein [Candidatus Acidoferrum sp.]|nr:dual specificity protein phosphatase family protein [Candidatus Acidoferrum sp.]
MGFLAFLVTTICATSVAYGTLNSAAGPVPAERTIARKLAVEGVPKLGEVSPSLYRGAQPTQKGFQKLAEMGISIVVDLRVRGRKGERQEVTKLGMRFVAIPWNCFHPKDTEFARFLKLLRENRGKKVFVHCQTGDDRTGMMIAAYRMAEEGWTAREAMKEMEAYGFTSPHHLICPGLSSYEAEFPARFKTAPAFRGLRASEHVPE